MSERLTTSRSDSGTAASTVGRGLLLPLIAVEEAHHRTNPLDATPASARRSRYGRPASSGLAGPSNRLAGASVGSRLSAGRRRIRTIGSANAAIAALAA